MLLSSDELPLKALSFDKGNEDSYVEVIIKTKKGLTKCSYNITTKNNIYSHLKIIYRNISMKDNNVKNFCDS